MRVWRGEGRVTGVVLCRTKPLVLHFNTRWAGCYPLRLFMLIRMQIYRAYDRTFYFYSFSLSPITVFSLFRLLFIYFLISLADRPSRVGE